MSLTLPPSLTALGPETGSETIAVGGEYERQRRGLFQCLYLRNGIVLA